MSNGKPWSEDDDATVRRMAGSGASDEEIARHMGRDVKLVGKKRRALNISRGISDAMCRAIRRINARARNGMTMRHAAGFSKVAQEDNCGCC